MSTKKNRILMFGYLPPPVFGPSVSYQALLRSRFSQEYDVTFIDITVVRSIAELERFHPGKLFKLLKFVATEVSHLLRHRFDFCCYPVSYNRNAFLKDFVLLRLARLFSVPVVLYAHGRGLPEFRQKLSPRLRRWLESTVRSAAGAIVIASDIRSDFDGLLPAERVFVVTHGIEPPPAVTRQPKSGFTILYLGALYRLKGVFDLIEALALVRRQRSEARLVLVGSWFKKAEELEARTLITRLGLEEAVVFTGPLVGEAKWKAYDAADVFAFVSNPHYEAFGMVLLEALCAGLPIVTSRGGARNEIVTDGVNGFLVDAGNVPAVADRLLQLAGDVPLRAKMGTANRERFLSYYTHEQYGQRMIEVFECLSSLR